MGFIRSFRIFSSWALTTSSNAAIFLRSSLFRPIRHAHYTTPETRPMDDTHSDSMNPGLCPELPAMATEASKGKRGTGPQSGVLHAMRQC